MAQISLWQLTLYYVTVTSKKYVVYAIPFTYIQHLRVKHQIDTSK